MGKKMAGLGMGLILVMAVSGGIAQNPDVEISSVNTAQDLDLSEKVVYALNFGNSANPALGYFAFSQDLDYPGQVSLSCTAENSSVPSWYGVGPNTGDSNLDLLLGSGAWTNDGPGACTTRVILDGLQPGAGYRLQLVFYEARMGENRRYDITVAGEKIVELYDVLAHQDGVIAKGGSVVRYSFVANDSLLKVEVTPVPDNGGWLSSISALILTRVWVPSPDVNGDSHVDIKDLIILIEHWGQAEPLLDLAPLPTGDGVVDIRDIEVFMTYWGQEPFDSTLIGHWALDEAEGVIVYDSVGANDGLAVGLPKWRPQDGAVGGALELNGTTFVTANSPLSPADGVFSVLAWVKGGAPGQTAVSQAGGTNWLAADGAEGVLMTELGKMGPSDPGLLSQAVITDGSWHRVVFVWDGATRRLCVDSVLVAEDTQSSLANCRGKLVIGAARNMAPGTFWTGLIDDIRIYDRAVIP